MQSYLWKYVALSNAGAFDSCVQMKVFKIIWVCLLGHDVDKDNGSENEQDVSFGPVVIGQESDHLGEGVSSGYYLEEKNKT